MSTRYAVILFVRKDTGDVLVSETVPLVKRGRLWYCPADELKLAHLGLQRVDGRIGEVVEIDIDEPHFHCDTDYFVFVGRTQWEADIFAAGAMTMRATEMLRPRVASSYDAAIGLN